VVVSAGHKPTPQAAEALNQLCQTYWHPLYFFVRRMGHSIEDAEDLTQEFFLRLLEGEWIGRADPTRGRFRSFLLIALKRFVANQWRRQDAQKRGGHIQWVPLAIETAETRLGTQPADDSTPEQVYERAWALAVLEQAIQKLRAEFQEAGNATLFEAIQPCLLGDRQAQPYVALAKQLDMSEGAIKVAVHRLRQRYRECLREVVSQTVSDASEVEAELRHLFAVLIRR
jgi:RNA polymerase sigma factor (sigma-70 family)